MANIQYYLSARSVGDSAQVQCRFYSGRLNLRAKTPLYILRSSFANGGCIISRRYETPANAAARQTQRQLDELAAHIYSRFTTSPPQSQSWLQQTVDEFFSPTPAAPPIYTQVEEYCRSRQVATSTRKKLMALGQLLKQFEADTGERVTAATLTTQVLDRLADYLLQRHQARNSVSGRLRQLRSLVYWVGKPTPNPFDEYTIPADTYGTPIYLTAEELQYLYMYDDFTLPQLRQRDIFIFQCLTGCRVADLMQLTAANIQEGWLVYIPQKTSRHKPTTIEVPLSPTALEIIERYHYADIHGRLLPFIAPQKYNEAIQRVCKIARLDRSVMVLDPHTFVAHPRPLYEVVTSHVARKTFTQLLYAATGDKRLVASMTGHSENSQAFNRYSEINRAMKQRAGEILAKSMSINAFNLPIADTENARE